ncbi:MAG: hypothetical protein WAO95_18480 [Burkholderiales bacterium]
MADPKTQDDEVMAITAITAALSKLSDPDARRNVLSYINARYLGKAPGATDSLPLFTTAVASAPVAVVETTQRELPGVARLTDTGELRITARDLKAKNALDAAVRLAHIAVYAHERLTQKPLSSRKGLTPLLKEWRVYDGNTRARIAKERGIIRSGDSMSLDTHARRDAERYIDDILNEETTGIWRPK